MKHITLFKKLGAWVENDAYVPKPGDYIFYDWQDGVNYATTDDTGAADHVGIVTEVNGSTITVIEGNMSDAVGVSPYRRQWPVYPGLRRAEVRQQGHGGRRRDDRRRERRDQRCRSGHMQGGRHRELHRREALHQRKRGQRHGL